MATPREAVKIFIWGRSSCIAAWAGRVKLMFHSTTEPSVLGRDTQEPLSPTPQQMAQHRIKPTTSNPPWLSSQSDRNPITWVLVKAGDKIYLHFCQMLSWGVVIGGHLQNILVWVLPVGACRDEAAPEWKWFEFQLSSAGVSVCKCCSLGREVCSHFFQSSCRAGCCNKSFTELKKGSQFQLLGLTMEPLSAVETGDHKDRVTSHFWGVFDLGKAPLGDGCSIQLHFHCMF